QSLLAQLCQRVDAFTAVHRFHRYQDAHLRGDLDHGSQFHNARLSATNSAVATPLSSILIRPRGPSSSTTAPGKLPGGGAISSTNVGDPVRRARRGTSAGAFATRFFTAGIAT